MFYSNELFVKKGLLAKLWLAGTHFRKLSKSAIVTSKIKSMCGNVSEPPLPLALPTQATLLRGVVRIENKKAAYLLGDALDAQYKVRVMQRSAVTLPKSKMTARSFT